MINNNITNGPKTIEEFQEVLKSEYKNEGNKKKYNFKLKLLKRKAKKDQQKTDLKKRLENLTNNKKKKEEIKQKPDQFSKPDKKTPKKKYLQGKETSRFLKKLKPFQFNDKGSFILEDSNIEEIVFNVTSVSATDLNRTINQNDTINDLKNELFSSDEDIEDQNHK